MHWWILDNNFEAYKHLCEDEGIVPVVIEHRDNKSLVDMTVHMSSVWNMCGYWYEFG